MPDKQLMPPAGIAHEEVAQWAAGYAEQVLALFEASAPDDNRPRQGIEAARAWARGELSIGKAREAAFACHAAAREVEHEAARAAARSAGHAAATAHVADHARHAASYAAKAVRVEVAKSAEPDAAH